MSIYLITDPDLAPSKRYCLILNSILEEYGFSLLKSKNTFVRKFEFGTHRVSLQFVTTMGFIHSVGVHFTISFDQMDKLFKKEFNSRNPTLRIYLGYLNQFLFDEASGTYSDKTLNDAASHYFSEFHPKIETACSQFSSYPKLFNEILNNTTNIIYHSSVPSVMRMGLFLAKYLDPNMSDKIRNDLEEYCVTVINQKFQPDMFSKFKETFHFISNHTIDKKLAKIISST